MKHQFFNMKTRKQQLIFFSKIFFLCDLVQLNLYSSIKAVSYLIPKYLLILIKHNHFYVNMILQGTIINDQTHIYFLVLMNYQIYNLMQKEKEKYSREYENLKRDIHALLKDFERNRQWADFSNWLHRLYQQLSKKRFQYLPQQITLCKRLAQCLNPALPAGVHTTVLKVYEVIFKNFENKTELLPLIALGLFPFFEHSNYANKIALIKLFDEHFVNEPQAVQMIVGLTNALLTGLNQNSEQFTKKIYNFFDKFSKNYGKIWVDGAVWINILKSPKVRLAGFKYFMKVFKDRDRISINAEGQNEQEKELVESLQIKIQNSNLKQEEKVLLASLHGYRNRPDEPYTRFPNFSTLVVNTICICLQVNTDQMIKRSTLDLLINYLKLNTRIFEKQEGVLILQKMLQLLQTKQYNLTNRVYKYLFDQPNTEGQFHIDFEKKSLELQILQQALSKLLDFKTSINGESILLILEIILNDHPVLTDYLLTRLSFKILLFIRDFYQANFKRDIALTRGIQDFYLGVIIKNKKLFLRSIIRLLSDVPQSKIEIEEEYQRLMKNQRNNIDLVLQVLQFYFSRLQRIGNPAIISKSRIKKEANGSTERENLQNEELDEYKFVRTIVIRQLITYIYHNPESSQKIIGSILDLSNQLLQEFLSLCPQGEVLTSLQIGHLQQLLQKQAKLSRKFLYAKLITLIPQPRKQQLLPYIEDSSLSIVCLNILLGGDKVINENYKLSSKDSVRSSSQKISFSSAEPIPLTKQQEKYVFTAIFKLLNCHLFETRALEFIERFRHFYTETFNTLINSVEPSQWLIYWKKVEGDVSGGIIRMIQNLDSLNSFHKHLSRKWINQSQPIISKVIDPIYAFMNKRQRKFSTQQQKLGGSNTWKIEQHDKIYNLMRLVFRCTSPSFSKYFFLQRDKYLNAFIIYIFKCIETDLFEVKSKSLQMLTFLLDQTRESTEKYDIVNLTLPNVISILDKIIDAKCTIKDNYQNDHQDSLLLSNIQIELLEYISKIINSINQILKQENNYRIEELIRILRSSNIYEVILKGMVHTQTSYIKTLYMDSSRQISEMIAQLDRSKSEITAFMTKILDQFFIMLKNTDMNTIEQIIKGRNGNTTMKQSVSKRKKSYTQLQQQEVQISFYKQSVKEEEIKHNLNLQEKYGEIIELWNAVKFYIQFAIKIQLKQIPVINLISLILQSFPFSYLKYTCAGGANHQSNLQALQEEINNVTGLKKQVLQIFEILWNKQSRQILDFLIEKGDPRILVHSSLDPTKVLQTFNKNSKIKEVIKYFKMGKFNLPRNQLHYNLETLLKENQLLYFIYIYFLYFNIKSFKNKRVSSFFQQFIQFLKIMKLTSHIQSKLWILEILQLISRRMMMSKDISVENWGKMKQQIQDITKQLIDEVVSIIVKSKLFTHRTEVKTGIFNLFNKEEKQTSLYDFVKIFPPTIFQSYQKYTENLKKISKNKQISRNTQNTKKKNNEQLPRQRLYTFIMQDDQIVLEKQNKIDQYLFIQFLNRSDQEYVNYLSLCCLKTLIRIGNSMLINVYQKQSTKINIIIKEILINILPICQNRDPNNLYFNQLIAQYLHNVLNHEQLRIQIIKLLRKNILDVFMANDFFKCTQKTLFYWKVVIDYCTQNHDLLAELLSTQSLLEGIFTKKAQSTRQKIKSFERVCFVIYSGKIDKYENKLRTVLQSLNQVMKQDNPSPALLILILFCIRILLMRLSTITLNKLFRSVWPSLITVLIQIFKKDKTPKNANLLLAGLKTIELIHALELEQFMLHKWMFIFDYFGLKIDPMGDIEDNMKNCQLLSPFAFKPYLTNALPNTRLRCKFMPDKSNSVDQQFMTRRRLIVKPTNIENDEQLREYCVLLMQYMMDLNEFRSEISKDDIENLIEEDFISLDNYIFKMK